MKKKSILITSLVFSIMGVLFSGYLTFTKFVLGYCPLRESCPYLWGYPVCVYGFMMFFALFVASITMLKFKEDKIALNVLLYVSILGILFSLYYTYQELFVIKCPGGCVYSLGIPTCIYGFVMYLAIHICVFFYRRK